jgi:DUF4097 and DUF4098 domain-containing protein YvlB
MSVHSRSVMIITAALAMVVSARQSVAQSKADFRRQIDTTFAFNRTGTVLLGNGAATIIVTGWGNETIRVKAHGDDGGIRFEASSSRVLVEPMRSQDDVIIQVMVPRGVHVVAHTNSGDITIKETRGDVEVESTSGDVVVSDAREVNATNLSGDIDLRLISSAAMGSTNDGDVSIIDAKGTIEGSSISGSVLISKSWAKVVRATTTNGDVSFDGVLDPEGRYDFVSHSGSVDIAIPRDANAQIGITTWNGTVDSEFPITLKPGFTTTSGDATKRYNFTLGLGGARLTAETFSGDINIMSRGGK